MNNPYADEKDDVDLRIGRRAAYRAIYLFLLLITLPPLYRNISEKFAPVRTLFTPQSDEGIVAHLKAAETKIEDAPFTEPTRRIVQTALTRGPLHEGNSKTYIGRDGWLYFKTALDSLTGYGPLRPEPDSVAKDPNRNPWKAPLAAITTFANQLAETDTRLLFVPVPVKPMIYPEHLGVEADKPLAHPDADMIYKMIAALPNVEVLDLSDTFWAGKDDAQLFLKQDTHWTPEGMQLAAHTVGEHIVNQMGHGPGSGQKSGAPERRESLGDLVEKLDIGQAGFATEGIVANPVTAPLSTTAWKTSPIVLLGDSFTNIYSDAVGLNWGANAGFAEHLALHLGTPLDVIAINGGGATEVREALAKRKGAATLMKDKKLVIWAIAARDLFLSETAAKRAEIEWDDVVFDTREPEAKTDGAAAPPTRVRAKLLTKASIPPDPKTTSYTALLYAAEYQLLETLSGEPPETEEERFLVLHWAFKDRQFRPSAGYKIGSTREMQLVPFDSKPELKPLERRIDSDLFLDLLWAVEPSGPDADPAAGDDPTSGSPLIPASGCVLFAALLGLGLRRASRRTEAAVSH